MNHDKHDKTSAHQSQETGEQKTSVLHKCGHYIELVLDVLIEEEELERIRLEELCFRCVEEHRTVHHRHHHHRVRRLVITPENTMQTLSPGNTIGFLATPSPAGSVPPASNPISWSSSNPLAPVTANPSDSTQASVTLDPTISVGDTFVLTASYTNADGTTATPGSFSGTVVAPPSPDITSLTITQVS